MSDFLVGSGIEREFVKHLNALLMIPSPTGQERRIADYCINALTDTDVWVTRDAMGQLRLQRFEKKTGKYVLLSAHMDTVQTKQDVKFIADGGLARPGGMILGPQHGYDDKVGIAMILAVALATGLPFKALLETGEEGGPCYSLMEVEPSYYNDVANAVVLDRQGDSDLIVSVNGEITCDSELAAVTFSDFFGNGYRPADGRGGAPPFIAPFVPVVNVSVGYFDEHTPNDTFSLTAGLKTIACLVKHLGRWRGSD